jgi:DnaJ-class molecular chaperone
VKKRDDPKYYGDCGHCDGSGACPACHALGVLNWNEPDETNCPECDGTGTCQVCKGTGRVYLGRE